MNFEQYTKCIEKIKDYIIEGDVMQVVFAQERSADFDLPPFDINSEEVAKVTGVFPFSFDSVYTHDL